jgi:cytochrome c
MKLKFVGLCVLFLAVFAGPDLAFSQAKKPKAVVKPVVKTALAQKPVATVQEIEEGKMLISKSDCIACHHAENKMVGPSYLSISQKYPLSEASVNHLAQKVTTGGSGVWGEIPMPPHAATAPADLQKMVKYILSLKAKS